ncbi:DNA-binding protein [Massilia sp. 9096]|uniref:DNA-binding protein n=1 Tax=Massilia sp. 9096 TaxID=1500894 RepID=UPI00068BAEF5|nr:DNA-binding protein [Massilia sp. 9096]
MARSGLTKSQVRTTRERLLAEGRYPSVDAVRQALGDSGSKSTIHRFLKELREEEQEAGGLRREDTGNALHALVDQLADRLHLDAAERIRQLRAEHEHALRARDAELAALRETVAALEARLAQQAAQQAAHQEQQAFTVVANDPLWSLHDLGPGELDNALNDAFDDTPGAALDGTLNHGFGQFGGARLNARLNSRSSGRGVSPFSLVSVATR